MNNIAKISQLVETFSIFDDFIAHLQLNKQTSGRKASLSLSEVATISLIKSEYGIRTWKGLYKLLQAKYTHEFNLPSYKSFVLLMNNNAKAILVVLNALLQINQKQAGIIKFIDSTPLPVCKNTRIYRHKTMKKLATRSKTTTGWFYGLKLHLASDLKGNILHIRFTTASVGDRVVLDRLLNKINNSIILADAGYCSKKLEKKARKKNNILLTCLRKNMRKVSNFLDICLLNLRPRIETLFSILKERLGLVTSLPRSADGYLAHYIHVIFGYMTKKALLIS
jgi:hypothetical protein